MSSPRHVSGPQSSDTRTPSSFFHFLRGSLFRLLRLIGNSLLYGSIFALITGSIAYAATGTKMLPNFLSSGVDFISFFSDTGTGNAGVDAKSFYARANGSWIGYPGNGQNYNYLRNHTFLSGTLIDENNNNYYVNPDGTTNLNQLCLRGDCKTSWPGSGASGGIVTGPLRWSDEYTNGTTGYTYEQAWTTCAGLIPVGTWRIPSEDEIEIGRHLSTTLFTGNKNYWSSSLVDGYSYYGYSSHYFLAWSPVNDSWGGCFAENPSSCSYGLGYGANSPLVFRCVSNI